MKKAFTLIELIIVIVIIGILAAIAAPKLFATRDDAIITKVRTDISNIRSAIADYHTKQIMEGNDTYPKTLDVANANEEDQALFEGNHSDNVYLLEYPVYSKNTDGHWMKTDETNYTVKIMNKDIKFNYYNDNGHFDCNGLNSGEADTICAKLTH